VKNRKENPRVDSARVITRRLTSQRKREKSNRLRKEIFLRSVKAKTENERESPFILGFYFLFLFLFIKKQRMIKQRTWWRRRRRERGGVLTVDGERERESEGCDVESTT
jgi:hypothetical protein